MDLTDDVTGHVTGQVFPLGSTHYLSITCHVTDDANGQGSPLSCTRYLSITHHVTDDITGPRLWHYSGQVVGSAQAPPLPFRYSARLILLDKIKGLGGGQIRGLFPLKFYVASVSV